MRVAKDADHLKLRAGVKQTLEQAHSALRIQTAFIHSQLNLLGKQATNLGEGYTGTRKDTDNREKRG
jgi:hypothetical protein